MRDQNEDRHSNALYNFKTNTSEFRVNMNPKCGEDYKEIMK